MTPVKIYQRGGEFDLEFVAGLQDELEIFAELYVEGMIAGERIEHPRVADFFRRRFAHAITQPVGQYEPSHCEQPHFSEGAKISDDLFALLLAPFGDVVSTDPGGRRIAEIPAIINPGVINANQHSIYSGNPLGAQASLPAGFGQSTIAGSPQARMPALPGDFHRFRASQCDVERSRKINHEETKSTKIFIVIFVLFVFSWLIVTGYAN